MEIEQPEVTVDVRVLIDKLGDRLAEARPRRLPPAQQGVAERVEAVLADFETTLPAGVQWRIDSNSAKDYEQRLSLLMTNGFMAIGIVLLILAAFLEIRLAFWVMLGIPVCFLGAMAMINTPYIDASLNMISIFGFILVLGIVVDDAIIMGESAYTEQERHGHSVDSVINGVYRVATPATFGVLTSVKVVLPGSMRSGL